VKKSLLLNTAYLAPIDYYSQILHAEDVYIEANENYLKQSYRNRCEIYGANGKLPLSIPIVKVSGSKMPIRDVRIDNSTSWKRIHLTSIESAYRSSPFYEYYSEEIFTIISNSYNFLFDLNFILLTTILSLIEINKDINLTKSYTYMDEFEGLDSREYFHPKHQRRLSKDHSDNINYHQVFKEKHGFISGLSIVDLIFNKGPESEEYLLNSNV